MRLAVALAAAAASGSLLLAGCVSGAPRNTSGQVTATASVDPFQITVGDCTGPMKEGDVSSLQVVPCEDSHHYEAFASTELEGTEFPGDNDVRKQADKFCAAQFKTFVGLSPKDSRYAVFFLYPVEDSWKLGDREVLCLAGADKGGIKGSLKGVKK